MKKLFKLTCLTMSAALCLGCLFGCSGSGAEEGDAPSADENAPPSEHSKVLFEMESGGTFTVELYPEYAPATVANFLKLVGEGFYDGLTFHRVVDDFMAQGGCPEGTGNGSLSETIPGEFTANGFAANTLHHDRGVISMARRSSYDSASCQFFICYSDRYSASLDGSYAAFGKVVEGMETIDAFLEVERTYNSSGELASPTTPIVIKSAAVL